MTSPAPARPGFRTAAPRRWLRLGLWLLLSVLMPVQAIGAEAVAVVVSPDSAEAQLDRRLLLSIFTGRVTTWPDGRPLRVFTLPDDHPVHESFCRDKLGTYPYVLRSAWDKLVYTGTGFAPTLVGSEAEMRRRVAETRGAIGYASPGVPSQSAATPKRAAQAVEMPMSSGSFP